MNYNESHEKTLKNSIASVFNDDMRIRFDDRDRIEKHANGKFLSLIIKLNDCE